MKKILFLSTVLFSFGAVAEPVCMDVTNFFNSEKQFINSDQSVTYINPRVSYQGKFLRVAQVAGVAFHYGTEYQSSLGQQYIVDAAELLCKSDKKVLVGYSLARGDYEDVAFLNTDLSIFDADRLPSLNRTTGKNYAERNMMQAFDQRDLRRYWEPLPEKSGIIAKITCRNPRK